jgi:hypothetical protein
MFDPEFKKAGSRAFRQTNESQDTASAAEPEERARPAEASDPLAGRVPSLHEIGAMPNCIYCLWRHVGDQVSDVKEQIKAAIADKDFRNINVFYEAVGSTPEHRAILEKKFEYYVNKMSTPRWLLNKSISSWITSALGLVIGSSNFRQVREQTLDKEIARVEMFRELRKQTGAQVRFKLVDMDKKDPMYREHEVAMRAFLQDSLSDTLQEPSLEFMLSKSYQEDLDRFARSVAYRDRLVREQLARHAENVGDEDLNIVMVGAMHAAVARGASRVGSAKIVSAAPEEVRGALPEHLKDHLLFSIDLIKVRKLAYLGELDDRDRRELILTRGLGPLVRRALQDDPRAAGKSEAEICELSDLLISIFITRNKGEVDRLWGLCLRDFNPSSQRAVGDRLFRRLEQSAEELLREPRKWLGFDPFGLAR